MESSLSSNTYTSKKSILDTTLIPNKIGKRGEIRFPKKSLAKMKHGKSHLPVYYIWRAIKSRCYLKSDKSFLNYGGRGIKICERWSKFENFYEDMGDRPYGLEIERIDNNGNYEPSNCRWATHYEQVNNRRSNVLLTYKGLSKNVTQWAKILNVTQSTIYHRIRRGWDVNRIIETPMRICK